MHAGVWPMCPGGSRRVLEPGEFVLVKKVDGRWPMTNRVFNAIEDALVRETGSASMRTIETVVETYLDALAGDKAPPFDTHLYPTSTNRAETLGFE